MFLNKINQAVIDKTINVLTEQGHMPLFISVIGSTGYKFDSAESDLDLVAFTFPKYDLLYSTSKAYKSSLQLQFTADDVSVDLKYYDFKTFILKFNKFFTVEALKSPYVVYSHPLFVQCADQAVDFILNEDSNKLINNVRYIYQTLSESTATSKNKRLASTTACLGERFLNKDWRNLTLDTMIYVKDRQDIMLGIIPETEHKYRQSLNHKIQDSNKELIRNFQEMLSNTYGKPLFEVAYNYFKSL